MTFPLVNMSDKFRHVHLTHETIEDFDYFVDADRWTKTDGDSGASVAEDADGVNGVVQLTTGATDNNEAYLATSNELFKFEDNKPMYVEAMLKYTEANTDDANVIFGLMDAGGSANDLQDDGAGPKASYSGAVFFKVDGETEWTAEVSDSTTQKTQKLDKDNTLTKEDITAGGSWQRLGIEIHPNGSLCDFVFLAGNSNEMKAVYKVKDFDISNATELDLVVGVKAGSANSEVLNVDYIKWAIKR